MPDSASQSICIVTFENLLEELIHAALEGGSIWGYDPNSSKRGQESFVIGVSLNLPIFML